MSFVLPVAAPPSDGNRSLLDALLDILWSAQVCKQAEVTALPQFCVSGSSARSAGFPSSVSPALSAFSAGSILHPIRESQTERFEIVEFEQTGQGSALSWPQAGQRAGRGLKS